MANVVGERFQITIDRKVRRQLGIRPGDLAVERAVDGRLVVEFVSPIPERSLRGIVKRLTDRPVEPIADWDAALDRAWAARAGEIVEEMEEGRRRHEALSGQPDDEAAER